jgi:sensor histidine kinase regulating citrate/malate metabolism
MAVYRHDMRHHLLLLDGLLSGGNTEQAREFIKTVLADLNTFAPKKFCENETVNLLCSSYDSKAQRMGVQLRINALLPKNLPLSDTEMCSVISNGLENALQASSQSEVSDKWVEFYAMVKQKNIFIQIRNPYAGEVIMQNGLPVSRQEGHGYGCQSIQTIVSRNGGHCSFEAENGLFTLRLVIHLQEEPAIK